MRFIGLIILAVIISAPLCAFPSGGEISGGTPAVGTPKPDAPFPKLPPLPDGATLPVQIEGRITDEDYPADAIRSEESGTTVVMYVVATDGGVSACKIAQSSGSASLDQTSCEIVKSRFRFQSAKDRKGRAVASTRSQRITWQLPDRSSSPLASMKPVNVDIELIVSPDGTVKSCRVLRFESSYRETSDDACPWATQGKKFMPFAGTKDRRVRFRNSLEINDVE